MRNLDNLKLKKSMGNFLPIPTTYNNVLILGLSQSGKTHLLYNAILGGSEDWKEYYRKGP